MGGICCYALAGIMAAVGVLASQLPARQRPDRLKLCDSLRHEAAAPEKAQTLASVGLQ
jgi:hypothetical protein